MTESPCQRPKALRCLVSGRVQGVGYRAATATRARELGLRGVARNLADGRVEVLATGAAAELAELVAWLWEGPLLARVTAVEIEDLDAVAPALATEGFETA